MSSLLLLLRLLYVPQLSESRDTDKELVAAFVGDFVEEYDDVRFVVVRALRCCWCVTTV